MKLPHFSGKYVVTGSGPRLQEQFGYCRQLLEAQGNKQNMPLLIQDVLSLAPVRKDEPHAIEALRVFTAEDASVAKTLATDLAELPAKYKDKPFAEFLKKHLELQQQGMALVRDISQTVDAYKNFYIKSVSDSGEVRGGLWFDFETGIK